ncbi:MAG TPA: glycosyltransferase family 9 protein [Candidatus Acidoferrales bacterium]|nr:glycosyltransferase family 9 protein [Candidatus Acidoferrales bacterium]
MVLFPGALGDFICFLPALAKIARARAVDLLARAEYAGIVSATVRVDSLERYEVSRLFSPGAEADGRLRDFFSRYDAVYSWLAATDATFVRSLSRLCRGDLRCFPFPRGAALHAADYYARCVGGANAGYGWRELIEVGPAASAWAQAYAMRHGLAGKEVLVIAPGSGAREKNWPAAAYAQLARAWERAARHAAVAVLGPAEEENAEIARAFALNERVVRGVSLGEIAALFRLSHVYVGNDSGMTHLAAALGVPTIAIFGPTDSAVWAPRGPQVRILSLGVECSPCDYPTMKTCPHRRCLTEFNAVDEILRVAAELKARDARPHLDKVVP